MSLNNKSKYSIARTMLTDKSGVSAMFNYGAVVNIDINSAKIFEDVCFSWEKRFTIAGNATVNILIDPSDLPDTHDIVILPLGFRAFGGGPINIDLYAGATYTADTGTKWEGTNRRFGANNINPETFAVLSPTLLTDGIKGELEYVIYSEASGFGGRTSIGGESVDTLVSVPRTDINYLFKFINTSSDDAQAHFSATIFEVERP